MKLLIILALLLLPSLAVANPLDQFGLGSRGAAMGSAMTAATDDFSALHYNVAGLTRGRRSAAFGFVHAFQDVSITLPPRPDGYDTEWYDGSTRRDNDEIGKNQGFTLGIVHDVGTRNLRLGMSMYFPTNLLQVQRTHFNTEIEQYFSNTVHFELIGERTRRQVITFGAAYRVLSWWSVGASLTMFQKSTTRTQTFQTIETGFDDPVSYTQLDNQIEYSFTGNGGMMFSPARNWYIGVSYREEAGYELTGSNNVVVAGFVDQRIEYDYLLNYTPAQWSLGLSYDKPEQWTVAVDATLNTWENFRNLQADDVTPLLKNTVTLRGGFEVYALDWLAVRAGYIWEPSPIPDTRGRENYVDNDRHVVSVGLGFVLEKLNWMHGIDLYAQAHLLRKRTVTKDLNDPSIIDEDTLTPGLQTGNPGFPGWTSDGQFYTVGITFIFQRDQVWGREEFAF